jgi:nucleotide-binding universal stress UspA family protein
MIRIKNILFPTDFSRCAAQAMDHALFLAKKYGAELRMLHAIVLHDEDPHNPAHHFPDVETIDRKLTELAAKDMKAAALPHKDSGVKIVMDQMRGVSAADVILVSVEENDIDLIVMGTHGRRGLGHLFLGSTAEEVVRFARCPVLTIREMKKERPAEKRERVLVPVDFSEHSRTALHEAREIAALYGARLDVLHVIEETVHPAFYGTGMTDIVELRPDIVVKSKAAMEKLFNDAGGPEVKVEFRAVIGRAHQEIVKYASLEETDLIVIATHGLSGLERMFIGSVAEKVVRRAPCPVLTVKAFGKSLVGD